MEMINNEDGHELTPEEVLANATEVSALMDSWLDKTEDIAAIAITRPDLRESLFANDGSDSTALSILRFVDRLRAVQANAGLFQDVAIRAEVALDMLKNLPRSTSEEA